MMATMLRGTNTGNLLYHYTSASTALEFILHDMRLRLSPLHATNDPADEGLPSPIAGDRADDHLFFELEDLLARRTIACFSRDRPEVPYHSHLPLGFHGYARDRMWAQYADRHRGVCLFFDRQALESAFHEQMADHGITLAGEVAYSDEVSFAAAPFDKEEYARAGRAGWLKQTCRAMTRQRSFVKRTDWESEQEYRLVFVRNPFEPFLHPESIWIRSALTAVCVGHHFPEGLLPCIRTVCDREKINAFRLQYVGGPEVELLYPSDRPYPSPFIDS